MTARTCVTPGCEQPAVARGMCNAHYARARREGRKTEIPVPPEDRPATDYSRAACLDHDPELWFPAPNDDDPLHIIRHSAFVIRINQSPSRMDRSHPAAASPRP